MKKALPYIILNVLILIYSFGSIFSKLASAKTFLSFEWCILYGTVILILGIYAVVWQQLLKKIPLNIAYSNKAITLIWGMIWGVLFFNENITLQNVFGAVIVLAGVILMVTGEEKKNE